jgi:hypothetical protein
MLQQHWKYMHKEHRKDTVNELLQVSYTNVTQKLHECYKCYTYKKEWIVFKNLMLQCYSNIGNKCMKNTEKTVNKLLQVGFMNVTHKLH